MDIIQILVLAIVQGITEFLPISSSAHLILAPLLVEGWADQGRAVDVAAHVGSLGAVLLVFRNETGVLAKGAFDTVRLNPGTDAARLFLMICAATIPLVLVGGALSLSGLADQMRTTTVIGIASIVFGIALYWADRRPVTKTGAPRSWSSVMAIGAAQALAPIPGTSRSGITMTAARFLGFSREEAARFSMLLAIPAILISGAFETLGLLSEGAGAPLAAAAVVAVLSFFTAWAAIVVFLRLTRTMSFTPFVIYRIAMGIALLSLPLWAV